MNSFDEMVNFGKQFNFKFSFSRYYKTGESIQKEVLQLKNCSGTSRYQLQNKYKYATVVNRNI